MATLRHAQVSRLRHEGGNNSIWSPLSVIVAPKTDATTIHSFPNTALPTGCSTGHRMVHAYRGVDRCLRAAAHYEHQAKRAADPTAQQKFLAVAAQWRQLAANDQSRDELPTVALGKNDDTKQAPAKAGRMVKADTFGTLWRQAGRTGARLLLHLNEVGRRRKF
jgi:hypothetical protein